MSKRVRGPVRAHRRPGARPASERPSAPRRRVIDEAPSQLEAATVIAEDIVEDDVVVTRQDVRRVGPQTQARHRTKAGSLLAVRAATEYVYVAQDMRRILLVCGILVAVLIALWLLIVVLRVIPLEFY
jgi:hypothetical protein